MTSTRTAFILVFAVVLTVTLAAGARGQALPDLSGQWSLSASAVPVMGLEGDLIPCIWQGGGVLDQSGAQVFSQDVSLSLVSGPPVCPVQMNASLTGVLGSPVSGGVPFNGTLSGQLGVLNFSATVDAAGQTMSQGGLTVRQGPFAGTTGSWDAMRGRLGVIPTLDTVGLVVLVLLLVGASVILLRRRQLA